MSMRNLIVLAVVAGVAVGLAAWMHEDRNAGEESADGGVFQPELRERVNEVARLRIERADLDFEMVRAGESWVAPGFGNYPVRDERVVELLRGWALLEKQEALTSNPARFASLGLQDPSEPDAQSTRLVALDEAGDAIAAVLVGNSKWGGQPAVYVRADGSEQTWRCSGQLRPPRRATEWMDTQVASLAASDVAAAELRAPSLEEALRVIPEEGVSNWKLESVPEGMHAADPGLLRSLATTLGWANFETVQSADAVSLPEAPAFEVSYWTTAEQRIDVTGWEVDGTLWCRFEAELLPAAEESAEAVDADADADADAGADVGADAAPDVEADVDGEADGAAEQDADADSDADEAADQAAAREEAAAEVEEWNARWAGWLYQLPETKTRPWTAPRSDYLEPIPPEEEEAPPSDEGSAAAGEQPAEGDGGR